MFTYHLQQPQIYTDTVTQSSTHISRHILDKLGYKWHFHTEIESTCLKYVKLALGHTLQVRHIVTQPVALVAC